MSESPQILDMQRLREARVLAEKSGRSVLTELEVLTQSNPRELLSFLSDLFHIPVLSDAELATWTAAFDLIPLNRARHRSCLVLRDAHNQVFGVFSDPYDGDLPIWMESQLDCSLSYRLALPEDIQQYLLQQEESMRALDNMLPESGDLVSGDVRAMENLTFASISDTASPAVRLVNSTLYDAIRSGVSDIHMESTQSGLRTKYRIDGVLELAAQAQGTALAEQVISRIKVLSELDIAERRVPQDGSFRVTASGYEIDLRVSIMPSVHGEDAVIRILDKRSMVEEHGGLSLDASGFDSETLFTLRRLMQEPYGMVLVTGPTGSGKTTTLYGALTEINTGKDKIITIEDPVEYQLPGILQIPVNDKKGLTFARGLRSILRHDPDKIMVGEIRDKETAEIAVQSALTGHLVLSTVHANNVYDVFGRFTHMGIDLYSFVSALNGVSAQRLVRVICPHCREAYRPNASELDLCGLHLADIGEHVLMRGKGCPECRQTGYLGRKAIAEVLVMDDLIAELVVEHRPLRQIKEAARKKGTHSLQEAALALVMRGETTLEEVRRVTQTI